MTNDRKLDGLYRTVNKAFREGRFVDVDQWIGQLDIDWLFRKNKSILCGWLVTTSWATRRGVKLPNREKLSKRCHELMPEHAKWFNNLDRIDR